MKYKNHMDIAAPQETIIQLEGLLLINKQNLGDSETG